MERDAERAYIAFIIIISTHTLTWSVTRTLSTSMILYRFQLTRSRGAWHVNFLSMAQGLLFQLTRSRGAWRHSKILRFPPIQFQLTRSRGAWRRWVYLFRSIREFQLTRSRGAWLGDKLVNVLTYNFNSHAHVERDSISNSLISLFFISTHTLTWSVTLFQ